MSDENRASDEQLIEIARGAPLPNTTPTLNLIQSIAAELLHHRRRARADSRRAEQVKKLRWSVENTLTKVEHLSRVDAQLAELEERAHATEDALAAEVATCDAAAKALRRICDGIHQDTCEGIAPPPPLDILEQLVPILKMLEEP
jgi:hypothetical protein